MSNLLQNAAKFTNPGDRVTVHVAVDANEQRALVRVRDTGIGMKPETLTRIFDAFAQGDQSLERAAAYAATLTRTLVAAGWRPRAPSRVRSAATPTSTRRSTS